MVDTQVSPSPRRKPIREGLLSEDLTDLKEVNLIGSRCVQCAETSLGTNTTCPNCGGHDLEPIPLGKEGTVWTYTVVRNRPPGNYKGPEPFVPFGLALVELPEGIRVMAPLDIPVDEIEIEKSVNFRAFVLYQDDAGEDVVSFDFTAALEKTDMTDVSILGVGIHPFGRFAEKSYEDIGIHAAEQAMGDAGVSWSDIQSAYCSRMYLPATTGARILRRLGSTTIPICDIEAACASGGAALRQATLAIQSGEIDVALVLGVEKMPRGFMDPTMIYRDWQIEMGMSMNPAYWSMRARRHMHEFGTTDLHIAKVAYKNHRNSVHNPNAMYRKPFSIEEIMNSPMVLDPIRLFEICAANDGAAAVVVASEKATKRFGGRPIKLATTRQTIARYSSDFRCPAESLSATANNIGPSEETSRQAYEHAGVGPTDVDCFEVQDTDAFCEIELYEQLGLCPLGEAGRLIEAGETEIGGRFPVNASGGLISKGEPVGASHIGQVVELVSQLRGDCGPRQIEGAKVGMAHVLGAGGNCAVTILKA